MSGTPGVPIGVPVAPARNQFPKPKAEEKEEITEKHTAVPISDLMSKAIPAEARIPKLLRGNDGQVYLAPVRKRKKKKLSRCCLDCCPDTDREFPLRSFVCWGMLWATIAESLFYTIVSMDNGTRQYIPEPHLGSQMKTSVLIEPRLGSETKESHLDEMNAQMKISQIKYWEENGKKYNIWRTSNHYWWVVVLNIVLSLTISVLHCKVCCDCCGGGKYKTASQKYSTYKKASVLNFAKTIGEIVVVLLTLYLPENAEDHIGWLLGFYVGIWLYRVYCLLAAYQLVPPKPAVVIKSPLVVNVIQAEDQPLPQKMGMILPNGELSC